MWTVGGEAEVIWQILANHGGGYQYRLCPSGESLTEACFQRHALAFSPGEQMLQFNDGTRQPINGTFVAAGTSPSGSAWAMNPIPARCLGNNTYNPCKPIHVCTPCPAHLPECTTCANHPDPAFAPPCDEGGAVANGTCSGHAFNMPQPVAVRDVVLVPADLPPGKYVLGWRYDAESTQQVTAPCQRVSTCFPGLIRAPRPGPANPPRIRCGRAALTSPSSPHRRPRRRRTWPCPRRGPGPLSTPSPSAPRPTSPRKRSARCALPAGAPVWRRSRPATCWGTSRRRWGTPWSAFSTPRAVYLLLALFCCSRASPCDWLPRLQLTEAERAEIRKAGSASASATADTAPAAAAAAAGSNVDVPYVFPVEADPCPEREALAGRCAFGLVVEERAPYANGPTLWPDDPWGAYAFVDNAPAAFLDDRFGHNRTRCPRLDPSSPLFPAAADLEPYALYQVQSEPTRFGLSPRTVPQRRAAELQQLAALGRAHPPPLPWLAPPARPLAA